MIIVMKKDVKMEQTKKLKEKVENLGLKVMITIGEGQSILALVGDTQKVETEKFSREEGVEKVLRVQEPYKLASRFVKKDDTVIDVEGTKIGGDNLVYIAGPCSVETEDQIVKTAKAVKEAGAHFLRGGAFKPRTSPYSFQGLGIEGLKLLRKAKEATGLPIVTELLDSNDYEVINEYTDIIQIGARNMQNFALLKKVGKSNKPILLKRGMSSTIQEFLMSAEYIMSEGNEKVILCERGIRTFETYLRNTIDLNVITVIKQVSHLPIIIDPSHSTGRWNMVEPLSRAAVAMGVHGLMIEVHNDPDNALCDGAQSLKPQNFKRLVDNTKKIYEVTKEI